MKYSNDPAGNMPCKAAQVRAVLHRPRNTERELKAAHLKLDALSPSPRGTLIKDCLIQAGSVYDATGELAVRRAALDVKIHDLTGRLAQERRQCEALIEMLGNETLRDIVRSADVNGEPAADICERLYMEERTFFRQLHKARELLYEPAVAFGLIEPCGQ